MIPLVIKVFLFHKFRLEVDGQQVTLSKKESELLALLVVTAGRKVNAKNYWETVVKPQKRPYNGRFYSSASRILRQSLATNGIDEILESGLEPVRFCRINTTTIKCDYFDMLDEKTEFVQQNEFLPEYEWASDFYCKTREEFDKLMEEQKLFNM